MSTSIPKMLPVLLTIIILNQIQIISTTGDNVTNSCTQKKVGVCPPSGQINPSSEPCTSNTECAGQRLCCSGYCSDPQGSKINLKCLPRDVDNATDTPCYSDYNCGLDSTLKCCADGCNSYCRETESNCYASDFKADESACPVYLINPGQACSKSELCPGNQICCDDLDGSIGVKKCTDPEPAPDFCPSPAVMDATSTLCASDSDCEAPNTKCCSYDGCQYKCTKPVKNDPAKTVAPTAVTAVTSQPSTAGPTNPTAGPLNPTTSPANPTASPAIPTAGPTNPTAGPTNRTAGPPTIPTAVPTIPTAPAPPRCPSRRVCPALLYDHSGKPCQTDDTCGIDEKCCYDIAQGINICHAPSRPGNCPEGKYVKSQSIQCLSSSNCKPGKLCCPNRGCYYSCTKPVFAIGIMALVWFFIGERRSALEHLSVPG